MLEFRDVKSESLRSNNAPTSAAANVAPLSLYTDWGNSGATDWGNSGGNSGATQHLDPTGVAGGAGVFGCWCWSAKGVTKIALEFAENHAERAIGADLRRQQVDWSILLRRSRMITSAKTGFDLILAACPLTTAGPSVRRHALRRSGTAAPTRVLLEVPHKIAPHAKTMVGSTDLLTDFKSQMR